jgi:hypothetical protein
MTKAARVVAEAYDEEADVRWWRRQFVEDMFPQACHFANYLDYPRYLNIPALLMISEKSFEAWPCCGPGSTMRIGSRWLRR